MNKIKENNAIRLCDDKLFKEVFSKVPTALVRMVCDCLELDYDEIKGLKVVSELLEADFKELQKMATDFTDNGKADVVILGNNNGNIVGAASQTAIDDGIKINEIIKTAAGVLGGGGGGRLTLAQGAGKNTDKMDEAIRTAVNLIKG